MNKDIAVLREVCVKITQMLAGMGVKVTQQGAQAFVETDARTLKPKRVNIPHIPDTATEELILAIQGFIDHEVAHILFTDWSVVKKANKLGKAVAQLHNIVEDTYIERAMGGKFPGSAYNLDKLHHFFVAHITKPALAKVKGNPQNEFAVLMVPAARAWAGQRVFQDFMEDHWDTIAAYVAKIGELSKEFPKIRNSKQALDLAIKIDAALDMPKPKEAPKEGKPTGGKGSKDEKDGEGETTSKTCSSEAKPDKKAKPEKKEGAGAGKPGEDMDGSEGDEGTPDDSGEGAPGKAEAKPGGSPGKGKPDGDDADDDAGDSGEPGADEAPADDELESPASPDDGDDAEDGSPGDGADGEDDTERSAEGAEDAPDDGEPADPTEDSDGEDGDDDGIVEEGDDDAADGADHRLTEEDEDGVVEEGLDEEEDVTTSTTRHEMEGGEASGEETEGGSWMDAIDADAVSGAGDFDKALTDKIGAEAAACSRRSDYLIFSRDFDKVEVYEPQSPVSDAEMLELEDNTRSMIGVMQKDIERMMAARSQVLRVGGYRSGRLHTASLHKLAAGDGRVFRRNFESKSKDVAVSLLVDCSGSMGGSKIKTAMMAAYALSQTLERVKIDHEAIGFTTQGFGLSAVKGLSASMLRAEEARIGRRFSRTEALYMPIFKGFEERLMPQIKQRFVAMTRDATLANNIDGECVEIAAQRLLKRKASRHVLIVLSDGSPAGEGISHEQNAHLHRAIAWAESNKVETIGIGIQTTSVKAFYKKAVVLSDLSKLPGQVMGELRSILT